MVPLRVEARACTYVRIGPRANRSEPTLSTSALVYKLHTRRDLVPVKVCYVNFNIYPADFADRQESGSTSA